MASGRHVGQRPDCHTFLCKFWHFQMAVSHWKLAWLTPNLGILWISVSSFWLCESIVANPIIYRLVPRPSRFEIRQLTLQWCKTLAWKISHTCCIVSVQSFKISCPSGNGFWLVYEDLSIDFGRTNFLQNRDMACKLGCGLFLSPQLWKLGK